MTAAYPLSWPDGLPRHERRTESQFKTGLPGALKNVQDSLRLFGADSGKSVSDVVLSSNITLGVSRPQDPGVAVWFTWDGEQRCIAVDRYAKTECNLQAIHHILEARRTEMRHGGLHVVRQTFKGFTALPAPNPDAADNWWIVLGVSRTASRTEIEAAWRKHIAAAHPDKGGSQTAAARINNARDQAFAERTYNV